MKICKSCNSQLDDSALFCTNCGAPFDDDEDEGTVLIDDGVEPMFVENYDDDDDEGTVALGQQPYYESANDFEDEGTTVLSDISPVGPAYNSFDEEETVEFENKYFVQPENPTESVNPGAVNFAQQNMPQQKMDYLAFIEKFGSKKTKSNLKTLFVIMILSIVFSVASLGLGNFFAIIDVVMFICGAILIKKNPKWTFILIIAIYSCIGSGIGIAFTGMPTGLFAAITAVITTMSTKKINDAYDAYVQSGTFPSDYI